MQKRYSRSHALMSLLTGARPRLLALTSSRRTRRSCARMAAAFDRSASLLGRAEVACVDEPTLLARRRVGESTSLAVAVAVELGGGAGVGRRDLTNRGCVDEGERAATLNAVWLRPGGKGAEGSGVERDGPRGIDSEGGAAWVRSSSLTTTAGEGEGSVSEREDRRAVYRFRGGTGEPPGEAEWAFGIGMEGDSSEPEASIEDDAAG